MKKCVIAVHTLMLILLTFINFYQLLILSAFVKDLTFLTFSDETQKKDK